MSVDSTSTVNLLSGTCFQSSTSRMKVVSQLWCFLYAEMSGPSSCLPWSCLNTLSAVVNPVTGLQLDLMSRSFFLNATKLLA